MGKSEQKFDIRKIVLVLIAAILCVCALALAGCSNEEPAKESEEANKEVTVRKLGFVSEDALNMTFTNSTGMTITAVDFKPVALENADYGEDILADGEPWVAGESVSIFCDTYDVVKTTQKEDSTKVVDAEIKPTYDMRLTFEDGRQAVVHNIRFDEADSVQIGFDEKSNIAYLVYEYMGSKASTFKTEYELAFPSEEPEPENDIAADETADDAEASSSAEAASDIAPSGAKRSDPESTVLENDKKS